MESSIYCTAPGAIVLLAVKILIMNAILLAYYNNYVNYYNPKTMIPLLYSSEGHNHIYIVSTLHLAANKPAINCLTSIIVFINSLLPANVIVCVWNYMDIEWFSSTRRNLEQTPAKKQSCCKHHSCIAASLEETRPVTTLNLKIFVLNKKF